MAVNTLLTHFTHDLQTEAPPTGRMIHFICYNRNPETYNRYSGVVTKVSGEDGTRKVTLGNNSCISVDDGYKYDCKNSNDIVLPIDIAPNCNWSDKILSLSLMAQVTVGDTVVGTDGSFTAGSRKVRRKSRRNRRNRKSRR